MLLAVVVVHDASRVASTHGPTPSATPAVPAAAQPESAADRVARLLPTGVPDEWTPIGIARAQPVVAERLVRQYRGHARVYRERPAGFMPAAIVVHGTGSGRPGSEFPSVEALGAFFASPSTRAAAHYGVGRDGRIMRYVRDEHAAFHVATPGWNDVSVGIELLNDNTGAQPFPEPQLAAATELVRHLAASYDIPLEAVVRHRDVQPADRSDPAANFPWTEWKAGLAAPEAA